MEKYKIRWVYLVIGTISMFFAGVLYAWSVLKAPLGDEFGWGKGPLSLNYTIAICAFCFSGVLGSILAKKIGYLLTVVIAGVLSGVGFVLASTINSPDQILLLYLVYGVVAGCGIGIAYNVVIANINAWFPDKKGFSSGCLMMGFGIGSLVLGLIAQGWFETLGWSKVYLIYGVAMGIIIILSGILIRTPSEEFKANSVAAKVEDSDEGSYTPGKMLSSSLFWRAFIFVAVIVGIGTCTASFAADLSKFSGATGSLPALMAGIFSISNGAFRVVTGIVFDKFGLKKTMMLASILSIAASLVLLLTAFTGSIVLCFAALILTGFTCGMGPTNASILSRDLFGKKYYGTNFGIMNCNMIVAAGLSYLVGAIYDATGGYVIQFFIFLGLAVLGMIMNLTIKKKQA